MTTSEFNLLLAVIIWFLATAVAFSHLRERGWQHIGSLLGVFVWVSASLLVVTAAGGFLADESLDVARFVAAFMRGVLLVLIGGYSWDRWLRHKET